jgi:small-conductance mechanosensitive channel
VRVEPATARPGSSLVWASVEEGRSQIMAGALDEGVPLNHDRARCRRGAGMEAPTRQRELAIAATVAIIVTVVVAVAAALGVTVLAAFIAGAGTAAVAAYGAVANRLISDAKRSR